MVKLLVWVVKSVLGVAQFAILSRIADRTGLRNTFLHPVALALAQITGLNIDFLEILLLATLSCWLVWTFSALCSCLTASLGQIRSFGSSPTSGSGTGRRD